MAPVFEAAAREFEPMLRFAEVDTDAEPELASCYEIRSTPTLIMFKAGREFTRKSGALSASEFHRWIKTHL